MPGAEKAASERGPARTAGPRVADWLPVEAGAAAGGGMSPRQIESMAGFVDPIFRDGALPARIKLFAVFLIATIRGNDLEAGRGIRAAIRAGLTREQLADGLMAGVLSRGVSVLWAGLPWLSEAPPGGGGQAPDDRAPAEPAHEDRIAYFTDVYGQLPEWLSDLLESAPGFFDAYHDLRTQVVLDGPLLRREKELLLVAINAVERYDFGLLHHLRGAFDGGASWEQAVEALLVAVAFGGMPAWIEGAQVLRRVAAEHSKPR